MKNTKENMRKYCFPIGGIVSRKQLPGKITYLRNIQWKEAANNLVLEDGTSRTLLSSVKRKLPR